MYSHLSIFIWFRFSLLEYEAACVLKQCEAEL